MNSSVLELNDAQKDCLRLFYRRHTAKEIARALDIAPATVHQRLTAARRKLGVESSMEAARLLAEAEGPVYHDVLYDAVDIAPPPSRLLPRWLSRLPWPVPTRGRPTNDFNLIETIASIVLLSVGFLVAGALYFFAIRGLNSFY